MGLLAKRLTQGLLALNLVIITFRKLGKTLANIRENPAVELPTKQKIVLLKKFCLMLTQTNGVAAGFF
jgi:hypothetical protein